MHLAQSAIPIDNPGVSPGPLRRHMRFVMYPISGLAFAISVGGEPCHIAAKGRTSIGSASQLNGPVCSPPDYTLGIYGTRPSRTHLRHTHLRLTRHPRCSYFFYICTDAGRLLLPNRTPTQDPQPSSSTTAGAHVSGHLQLLNVAASPSTNLLQPC
jgi:hypothetical protein